MNFIEKRIFLLDGIGAALSALLTGLLLPLFSESTGLATIVLYYLALFPLSFCIYSLSCYWFASAIKPWMILIIVLANIGYCILSSILIFTLEGITIWGKLVLACEVIVILLVVAVELYVYVKILRKNNGSGII